MSLDDALDYQIRKIKESNIKQIQRQKLDGKA